MVITTITTIIRVREYCQNNSWSTWKIAVVKTTTINWYFGLLLIVYTEVDCKIKICCQVLDSVKVWYHIAKWNLTVCTHLYSSTVVILLCIASSRSYGRFVAKNTIPSCLSISVSRLKENWWGKWREKMRNKGKNKWREESRDGKKLGRN